MQDTAESEAQSEAEYEPHRDVEAGGDQGALTNNLVRQLCCVCLALKGFDKGLVRAADHLSQLDEVEKHYKARIAHLEARVTDLVAERAKEQVKHAKEQRFKDGLIKDLQIQLQEELDLVSRRQQEVEKLGPVLSQQLAAAKQQLVGDNISDAVYAELATKAPEQRSLAEEVRLITYVGLAKLRQENEQLRLASQV